MATGIYYIFTCILTFIVLNVLIVPENYIMTIAAAAFALQGLRLLVLKVLFQDAKCMPQSCFTLNIIHIWIEFFIFLVICIYYCPELYQLVANSQNYHAIFKESMVAFLYLLSLIFMHQGLVNQSLFSFTNQYIFSTPLLLLYLLVTRYLTLWSLAVFCLLILAFLVLKLALGLCC